MKQIIICILSIIGLTFGIVFSLNQSDIYWSTVNASPIKLIAGISIVVLSMFGLRSIATKIVNDNDRDF